MSFEEQMVALEWTAAGFGVLNIALLIWRSVWNYLFGIVMVSLYIFVFWQERLYAEAGLQVFFSSGASLRLAVVAQGRRRG